MTVTDVTGCTATACKSIISNSPRLVGCNLICNENDIVEPYGPPIWIENPEECTESILVCSQNQSIILAGPVITIRARFANEELCILEAVNTTSGSVCGTITGQDCSECLFQPFVNNSGKIEVFSCRFHYCYWPVGPGFYIDKEIEEVYSATTIEVADTGDCRFQLANGCIPGEQDAPIIIELLGRCAENLISQRFCGEVSGQFERGHVACFDTFKDDTEINSRSFSGISDSIWALAIESSFTINEDSTSIDEIEFEFDPWPKPNIVTDISTCNIIFSYESNDNYDHMKIKILDKDYSLVFEIDTTAVFGVNQFVLEGMDDFNDNEKYLVIIDLKPDYKLHDFFTVQNCANRLQNRTSVNKVINVVPNPFTDKIQILISEEQIRKNAEITIYDSHGKVVKRINKINNNQSVDLSSLANGLYYIEVVNQSSIIDSIKIIKQ